MPVKIYTDGGSRGNPGKAACSYIVVKDGEIIKEFSKYLGNGMTNNEAEYKAIILALENTLEKDIELISDSELVVKQITGKYKVNKQHLQLLNQMVQGLISGRNIKFSNQKRENQFIKQADKLLNKTLDKHAGKKKYNKKKDYFL